MRERERSASDRRVRRPSPTAGSRATHMAGEGTDARGRETGGLGTTRSYGARSAGKTMAGAGAGAKTRFGVVGLERGWRCTASELASLRAARPSLAFGLESGGACIV